MSRMSPEELAKRIGAGILSFPVTHFTEQVEFNEKPYRARYGFNFKLKGGVLSGT